MEEQLWKHKFNLWDYMHEVEDVKKNGYLFTYKRYGVSVTMYLPCYEKDWIQKNIVNYADFYESRELEYLRENIIPRDSMILDIGANIGNHTVFFGKICKAKKIYCFEPVAETFDILSENVRLNNLEDIVVLNNVALGDKTGNAKIKHFNPDNSGSTQVEASDDGNMKLARLDDYEFQTVDFIKIDVEGYEYNLLLGARETLKKHSPVIFIEIFDNKFKATNKLLEEYGYKMETTVAPYNYIYRKSNKGE